MAIVGHPWQLAEEAVQEYLDTAKDCLDYRKPNGGCRGYPAALLLLCVVDALGRFMPEETVPVDNKTEQIGGKSFRVLNHPYFGLSLSDTTMKHLKDSFRHTLAHNGLPLPLAYLNGEPHDDAFVFHANQVEIRLVPFYNLVQSAWVNFDKTRIEKWAKMQAWYPPLSGSALSVLPTWAAMVAPSGCP